MKFVCELCGSEDLLKQDGVFSCQSCGCKYSAEEAKKLLAADTGTAAAAAIGEDDVVVAAGIVSPAEEADAETPADNTVMTIEDIFRIAGRGAIITGTLCCDVSEGDTVYINGAEFTVTAIESSKQMFTTATAGMDVGLMLKKADFSPVQLGATVTK